MHFNSKVLRVKWMNLHVKCAIKVADWKVGMLHLFAYGISRLEFLKAAKLRGAHAQLVHTILHNFTIKDINQVMKQLIQRCQGNLDQ